ncbi:Hypothetical predicted protein, partial [Mytilus galloprovincialis]
DNCQCFNNGKCVQASDGRIICDCIGHWSGQFCEVSQCNTYDCGFGSCLVEPMNGTASCVCGDMHNYYCP